MSINLADTVAPMGNFPAVMAKHVGLEDGSNLQEAINNGLGSSTSNEYIELTQAEYDALSNEEKTNGTEYRTYDTGHIYKLGVEYGKDAYFTSLSQLGLTAPTTVGEVFMAMPEKSMLMLNVEALVDDGTNVLTVTDVPEEYGVLTIDKWSNSRFRIEFNISRGGSSTNIKQWIGTLKGIDGTGLKWTELATMDKVNALHKQTIGYITGSLLSSAVKFANLYYQKIGDNRLVINGWISLGSAVSCHTKIFTLPNGWKVDSNYLLPCYLLNSNSAYACIIDLGSSDVNSYTPLPSGGELRFCAEIYII